MDAHVRVPADPVLQERPAYVAVHTAGEEGERGPVLGRQAERGPVEDAVGEVHLRQRRVLPWPEPFRNVGVARSHPTDSSLDSSARRGEK
jgi:hypothetical protein